jgi:hypothetical protein
MKTVNKINIIHTTGFGGKKNLIEADNPVGGETPHVVLNYGPQVEWCRWYEINWKYVIKWGGGVTLNVWERWINTQQTLVQRTDKEKPLRRRMCRGRTVYLNLLVPELFLILAHPVYKMWIIHEPNTLELWNKLHFEEEKTESIYHV